MKNIILLIACILMTSCATATAVVSTKTDLYSATCKTLANHGKIDAHEVINMQKKTTFEATEYADCPDHKNVVVIKWVGEYNSVKVSLARQIVGNFFSHFHPGAQVNYFEINTVSVGNAHTIVYEFTRAVRAF